MAHLKNNLNCYALASGREFFDSIPKSVWAALAVSFATQGGDYLDKAAERIAEEWRILHENGIVPQAPNKVARAAIAKAEVVA